MTDKEIQECKIFYVNQYKEDLKQKFFATINTDRQYMKYNNQWAWTSTSHQVFLKRLKNIMAELYDDDNCDICKYIDDFRNSIMSK